MDAVTPYLLEHRNPHGDRFYPARQAPVLAIVVHITAGLQGRPAGADSSAERTAAYAASTDRPVSWHSGSDTDSHLQLLPDAFTAFHCQGYNSCTIGHEISKRDTCWADEDWRWVATTLDQAARSLAPRAARYGVPLRRASRDDLDRALAIWHRTGTAKPVGFIDHARLDPARRSDPGPDFPWARFLTEVARHTTPANRPTITEDDMTPEQDKLLRETHAMLVALGAPRRPDKTDRDNQRLDLGDVVTAVERSTAKP